LAYTITSPQFKHSKVPAITAAIICIIFALWSATWFWASVLTVRPEAVITQWEQNKEKPNQELALSMISRLNTSIDINPLDANTHLLLARFYEKLADLDFADLADLADIENAANVESNSPNQYNKLAELEYKNAIKNQPSWDYAWGKLANFYSNQQPLNNANIMNALSKAMLLGPYERKNQKVIIPLIFKHWPLIASNKEELIQATKIIKHALKYHTHALLTLNSAKKHQQLNTLAPMLTKKWHKNRLNKYLRETKND